MSYEFDVLVIGGGMSDLHASGADILKTGFLPCDQKNIHPSEAAASGWTFVNARPLILASILKQRRLTRR
jgi:hypothetical protein